MKIFKIILLVFFGLLFNINLSFFTDKLEITTPTNYKALQEEGMEVADANVYKYTYGFPLENWHTEGGGLSSPERIFSPTNIIINTIFWSSIFMLIFKIIKVIKKRVKQ